MNNCPRAFLPPIARILEKFFVWGLNYREHAEETGQKNSRPSRLIFSKLGSAILAHGNAEIVLPGCELTKSIMKQNSLSSLASGAAVFPARAGRMEAYCRLLLWQRCFSPRLAERQTGRTMVIGQIVRYICTAWPLAWCWLGSGGRCRQSSDRMPRQWQDDASFKYKKSSLFGGSP